MREINVGDRVRVAKHPYLLNTNQRVGTVARRRTRYEYDVLLDNYDDTIGFETYQLTVFEDSHERLSEVEAKIAALEAGVRALKDASKAVGCSLSGITNDGGIRYNGRTSVKLSVRPEPASPNQRRAGVIKRAQAFVGRGYDRWYGGRLCRVEYHVNSDKRTVVALIRVKYGNNVISKGIAKCGPNEVFNADIGKAIALGRALGVDIPEEFTKAVQPTEPVVGMEATIKGSFHAYEDVIVAGSVYRHDIGSLRRNPRNLIEILDDTGADYS